MTTTGSLAAALEREHHEIDAGIEAFLASRAQGKNNTQPLRQAITALRRHIYLEEEFVFPPLRQAGLQAPIFVMLREHGEIWDTIDAIDTQLATTPDSAPTQDSCHTLLTQLEQHNTKEEAIIYPQADITPDTNTTELRKFLTTHQMPLGWMCARAGA